MVKPLGIVLSWNRLEMLQRTLESLVETTEPGEMDLVVVDNGSEDGSAEWLAEAGIHIADSVHLLPDNIGCPRGFNYALEKHRQPRQAVAKIDGDVEFLTPGWVSLMMDWESVREVGIVTPRFGGGYDSRVKSVFKDDSTGLELGVAKFVPGHAMWITGHAMDQLGYFDVLAPDHFYGYDDVLMVRRCQERAMVMGIDERVDARNIQPRKGYKPVLPDGREQRVHAQHIHKQYRARLDKYRGGQLGCYVGEDGGLGCPS